MPLTRERPKPLCPVGNRALLDWALDALAPVSPQVAVNVHHSAEQIVDHLRRHRRADSVHVSVEEPVALGTAGAVARTRGWVDGRAVLVTNADTWHQADLRLFAQGWDGERVRILTSTPLPFGPRSGVVASILPWSVVSTLEVEPSGLWEVVWRERVDSGAIDAVVHDGVVVDCATPADYLRANLTWSDGRSVVADGATVTGRVERSVVWAGAEVLAHEHLVDAIRTPQRTVRIV